MPEAFGKVLRRLRQSKELTQAELARRINISKSQLCLLEKCSRGASKRVLKALIDELNPTLNEREELSRGCEASDEQGSLAPAMTRFALPDQELADQKTFEEVHVVARTPMELLPVSVANTFLRGLVSVLKDPRRTQRYYYWTTKEELGRFRTFIRVLEKAHSVPLYNRSMHPGHKVTT